MLRFHNCLFGFFFSIRRWRTQQLRARPYRIISQYINVSSFLACNCFEPSRSLAVMRDRRPTFSPLRINKKRNNEIDYLMALWCAVYTQCVCVERGVLYSHHMQSTVENMIGFGGIYIEIVTLLLLLLMMMMMMRKCEHSDVSRSDNNRIGWDRQGSRQVKEEEEGGDNFLIEFQGQSSSRSSHHRETMRARHDHFEYPPVFDIRIKWKTYKSVFISNLPGRRIRRRGKTEMMTGGNIMCVPNKNQDSRSSYSTYSVSRLFSCTKKKKKKKNMEIVKFPPARYNRIAI